MTRWTFYLILKDKYIRSVEFNWDMYPWEEWYWDMGFQMLDWVIDEKGFIEMVLKFNSKAHNYWDDVMYVEWKFEEIEKHFDMSKWYYDFWFSDWIFIKNMSWKKLKFLVKDYESWKVIKYTLINSDIIRFNFWQLRKGSIKKS